MIFDITSKDIQIEEGYFTLISLFGGLKLRNFTQGGQFVLLAIAGYLLFNTGIIQANGALNYGIFNILGGIATGIIFHKKVKTGPKVGASLLGGLGIVFIVFGLRWTYDALKDPASVMELVYDSVVFSSVAFWYFAENFSKKLGSTKSKIYRFDIHMHITMLLLVFSRIILHWKKMWSFNVAEVLTYSILIFTCFIFLYNIVKSRETEDRKISILYIGIMLSLTGGFLATFCPQILLTVCGYWLFNISLRIASQNTDSRTATNVFMNISGGVAISVLTMFLDASERQINYSIIIGCIGIICIVFGLGKAYEKWGEIGLSSAVITGTYDGLLLFAPLYFGAVYKQPLYWFDWIITLCFVIVMITRLRYYYKTEANFELMTPPKLCFLFVRV